MKQNPAYGKSLYPNLYKALPSWIKPRTAWELYVPVCKKFGDKPLSYVTPAPVIINELKNYEVSMSNRQVTYKEKPKKTIKNIKKKQLVKEDYVNSTEFLQSFEWRRVRYQAIKLSNGRCQCCGASPKENSVVLHVDHVKPRRKYPHLALVLSNLQVLCESCNHGKGSWDSTDWR